MTAPLPASTDTAALATAPSQRPALLEGAGRSRWHWAWRAAVLLCALGAFVLRLYRLEALGSFDFDEVASVFIGSKPVGEMLAYLRSQPFEHPPLFYLLFHGWLRVAGEGEWTSRFVALLPGTLLVPAVAALGRRLFNPAVGLLAAFALVVAPLHLFHSRDARMYSLFVLLATVAAYGLARALLDGGRWWWVLGALAGLAGVFTHYYAGFLLAAWVLAALCWPCLGRRRLLLLAVAAPVPAALGLWVLASPGLRDSFVGLMASARSVPLARALGRVGEVLRELALGSFVPDPVAPWIPPATGLVVAVAVAWALWQVRPGLGPAAAGARNGSTSAPVGTPPARGAWGALFVLLAAGLPLVVLGAALVLVGRPLEPRYLLGTLPFLAILFALACQALLGRWPALLALPALGWALLCGWALEPYYLQFVRGEYGRVTALVEAGERPGEVVVLNGPWQVYLFDHYYRGSLPRIFGSNFVPLDPVESERILTAAAAEHRAIWLLLSAVNYTDPDGFVEHWLRQHTFYVPPSLIFKDARVRYYVADSSGMVEEPVGKPMLQFHLESVLREAGPVASGGVARIGLRWRLPDEYEGEDRVSLVLRDPGGEVRWRHEERVASEWAEPGGPDMPTTLTGRYGARLPADLPPGTYQIEITAYRPGNRSSQLQRATARSETVRLPLEVAR